MIRYAALDSGKKRDQSALVSLRIISNGVALVEGCKFWPQKTEYNRIELDVARLHKTQNWHKIGVEVNGIGEAIYESLRRRWSLPVTPITTVARLSGDRVKKSTVQRLARSMPKNEMVLNFLRLKMDHKIQFPAKSNKDLDQLREQIAAFSKFTTEAGNIRYSGPGDSSDDGVMAMLLALYLAMPHLDTGRDISHVGGPAYREPTDTFTLVRNMQLEGWRQIA